MIDSLFGVDAGRSTGHVGRRERSRRRLVMPWARVIVTPNVSWARSCAAVDGESIILGGACHRAGEDLAKGALVRRREAGDRLRRLREPLHDPAPDARAVL